MTRQVDLHRITAFAVRALAMGAVFCFLSNCLVMADHSLRRRVWQESNGVILIEAESVPQSNLTQEWWSLVTRTAGFAGSGYLRFEKEGLWNAEWLDPIPTYRYAHPRGLLTYYVNVDSKGSYAVRLRNTHRQQDGDNDAWVSVNGGTMFKVWDEDVDEWTWDDRVQHYEFRKGLNRIVLGGRSAGFAIDRIAVVKDDVTDRQWMDADQAVSDSEWHEVSTLGRKLWKEVDGVVVIEAESLANHPHWTVKTTPEGYTGDAYVQWDGPRAPGHGNDDYTGDRLHPPSTHLALRLLVSNPGAYHIDVRNRHQREDGDNDAWVDRLGRVPEHDWPIKRIGDSHRDGKSFTWADWGKRTFPLLCGENRLFIGGRSPGFGIDRIVLWKAGDPDAKQRAHDLSEPPSEIATGLDALEPTEIVVLGARRFGGDGFVSFGRDASMLTVDRDLKRASAVEDFPGADGPYKARLVYLAEVDGASRFTVSMGDHSHTFRAEKKSSPEFESEPLGVVRLRKGDEIKVVAEKDEASNGRWRMIVFDPVR